MLFKNLLLLICVFYYNSLSAQNNTLISTPISQPTAEQEAMLSKLLENPAHQAAICINLNLSVLENSDNYSLEFFGYNYQADQNKLEKRSESDYSWFGDNVLKDGDIILTVFGNEAQGTIFKGNNFYKLVTLPDYSKVILHIDQNQFPEGECVLPNSPLANIEEAFKTANQHSEQGLADKASSGCTLRGLVMFTEAAENEFKEEFEGMNLKTAIQAAVDRANVSFEKSKISNYKAVELVLIQKTDYVEGDSMFVDLTNFTLKEGDSTEIGTYDPKAMDEVHTLRTLYGADFCVLITIRRTKVCGQAAWYKTQYNNSFYVVNQYCLGDGITFTHELGHLLGCQHDSFVVTNQKYQYGHGYVDTINGWRTLMAYRNKCLSKGFFNCPQIPYFSNLKALHPTYNTPMGVIGKANNSKVISLYADTLMTFEQPKYTSLIWGPNFNNNFYTSVEAKEKITTSGNVIVKDAGSLILKAGNQIELNKGFTVEKDCDVELHIEDVNECQ